MSRTAHPYRRQLVLNTVATSLSGGWAVLVAAVTLPILLGTLGRAAFGTWVLLQTFTATAGWMSIPATALSVACGRRVASIASNGTSDEESRTDGAVLSAFLITGSVAAALVALAGPMLVPHLIRTPDELRDATALATALVGVQILGETVQIGAQTVLEGHQRVDLARTLDGARRGLVTVGVVVAALLTGDLVWVAGGAAGASLISASGSLLFVRHWISAGPSSVRPLRGVSGETGTLTVLTGVGVIHRTMDRLLVGVMFGPGAVALVEIATRILDVGNLVLSASSHTTTSAAAWLEARAETARVRELLVTGTRLSLTATWPVLTFAGVLAVPIVSLWVGTDDVEAARYAVFGLLYLGVQAPLQVGQNILRGLGRPDLVLRAAIPGVLLNLSASLMLLDRFGPIGAFQGTLIGSLAIVPLLGTFVLREVGVGTRAFLTNGVLPAVPATLVTAAVGLVVLELNMSPLGSVAIGLSLTALLGGIAAIGWGVGREERQLVKEMATGARVR